MTRRAAERVLPRHDRRDDVQGLRAVAVLLVVAFHVRPDAVPGGFVGVDVFFVISGFLITRGLLVTAPRGRADLLAFWGRRIRRLLPAAFVVLAVTMVAARLLTPETEWVRTAREGVASAFYVQNWLLVDQATDYLAPTTDPTAVQHYWSLAVEEQFYLVWPLLLFLVAAVSSRRQPRVAARWVIGAVLVVSLLHSAQTATTSPGAGYFMTTTRVWELATGGLLATWFPPERAPRTRAVTAWAGLLVVVAAGFSLAGTHTWLGQAAAVIGACVFVWSASGERLGPGLLLGATPVQRVGDASYSIYLWHWPVVVLAGGAASFSLLDTLSALVITGALAAVTYRYVERPWRTTGSRSTSGRPFQLAALGTVGIVVIAAVQVVGLHLGERPADATMRSDPCLGAAALESGQERCPVDPAAELVLSPALAARDRASVFDEGCIARPPYDEVRTCTFGDGSRRVALVGNSHAATWLPAFEEISEREDLTITTYLITTCTTIDATLGFESPENARNCSAWRDEVLAATSGDRYDLVVTSQRSVMSVVGHDHSTTYRPWVTGMRSVLQRWTGSGADLLLIRDTPFPGDDVPECVAEHPTDQTACSAPRSEWELPDPLVAAARGIDGIQVADLNDHFCTESTCSGVIGGVVAYFDTSHVTDTYARTVAPYLRPVVADALARG